MSRKLGKVRELNRSLGSDKEKYCQIKLSVAYFRFGAINVGVY